MKNYRIRFFSLLLSGCALAYGQATADSTTLSAGWRFQLGATPGAADEAFDDSGWRELRVPHDWAIEGPFIAEADGGTAKLPWKGQAWYRRGFSLPKNQGMQRVYFDFDGVMAFPKVYINGQFAGEWDYGYNSFRLDATPYVKWGGDNVIAVHVDTRRWGSRWYPGAGIYRKVVMNVLDGVHFGHWGVQVQGIVSEAGSGETSHALVNTTVENHRKKPVDARIRQTILDPEGVEVGAVEEFIRIPANENAESELALDVSSPLLWDVDHPHLYTLSTAVYVDDRLVEEQQTRFGFRTFEFTADDGFHLNGRRVQLYGVNLHHDLGPLGGAFNRRAAQRQLEIMQKMGVNALRTSHNPPAPEVLDLCDEMGIVVWDEVFDKYAWTAGRPDLQPPLPEFSQRQIEALIKRDFNHPSVVLWSTGNEVWGEEELEGISPERVEMMVNFVRELDLSRPVVMACHVPQMVDGKNFAALDLTGWNYMHRYDNYRKQYPDKPVIYSESASTFSTRGFYDPELPKRHIDYSGAYQASSYDLTAAPWSDIPDAEFRLMEQDTFVAGEFVWTGFDYLGEPTPFAEQARSSYFGVVDLAGFLKDRFYLYRSHWLPEETTVHILPHWNWPNRVGQNVPVFVYTNGEAAELFLNGRSLGTRRKGERPPAVANLALSGKHSASFSQENHDPQAAADRDMSSEWRGQVGGYWQLDLEEARTIRQISVDTSTKENNYAYIIESSTDGEEWTTLVDHPTRLIPRWSVQTRIIHDVPETQARYVRITFTQAENLGQKESVPVGLKEFMVFSEPSENDYFDVTYDYRLRWNQVAYEPGELKVVAYKDGRIIGEARVETTGAPAKLEMSADRAQVAADGEDLVFITVNARDAEGRLHPLADDLVRFSVTGPGEIAAVGNGNPLSFEPFNADRRHLFYGKALLIVRPHTGEGGVITVKAVSPELEPAQLEIETRSVGL